MNNNKSTQSIVTYATGSIADKRYAVTNMRDSINGDEFAIGDLWHGNPILAIEFYTGFAGCPARYYVTTKGQDLLVMTFIVMA